MKYDIIVVGGGHAGCEAAASSAKQGLKTALITSNKSNIADMPCNPSIGGTAKGIVVREIDALGGLMGKIADISHLQIKMLNSGKGPAVKSLRAQGDKVTYPKNMVKELESIETLDIIEAMVEDLIVENNEIKGVVTLTGKKYYCKALILTTGTYLKSKILIGDTSKQEGPHGEVSSKHLSDKLASLGFEIQRLKTGTPQRLDPNTIDYSKLIEENGDLIPLTFSFDNEASYDVNNQRKCYLVYTNANTHQIIRDNLTRSAMYGGYAEGIGPRYCPSIEDKVVRFSDKERHQLFLEPESDFYPDLYLQGFSTSMPIDIQEEMVHSLVGLENAKILKYAYAIEYDAINPLQMYPSLESKLIKNLYTAGQINGTSGYEEAAGQGLIAGINAGLKLKGKDPLILKRNESYIGVLIDDLVTKGTQEPYRLLTSRAEYRLILRHDNADLRLRKYGYQTGLISEKQMQRLREKEQNIASLTKELKNIKIHPKEINTEIKEALQIEELSSGMNLYELLKRPQIKISFLKEYLKNEYTEEIFEIVEIAIKYEGYIAKTNREVEKMLKLESKKIPKDINYAKVKNLASEARQKLEAIRPETIAQATRISGVNPTDISILTIYLKKEFKIELTDDIMNKLNIYSSFLMEYNSHTNLTAIKNKEDIYLKHFYDSLTLAKFIDMHEINSLCDVGTGAGFPGIVLKIVFNHLHVTLIDSNNKKIKFLDELIKKLNLEKISTVLTRSEEYALNNLDSFDLVTARAVTTLPALIELCLPLVKVNGLFVPLKGNASEEINISSSILTTLNGTVENTYNFSLPKENSTRTIIKIRKTASNPKGYPRSYDKIKKSLKKYIK